MAITFERHISFELNLRGMYCDLGMFVVILGCVSDFVFTPSRLSDLPCGETIWIIATFIKHSLHVINVSSCFFHPTKSFQQLYEVETIIILFLKMGKLMLSDIKYLAQDHLGRKLQTCDFNSSSLSNSRPSLLNHDLILPISWLLWCPHSFTSFFGNYVEVSGMIRWAEIRIGSSQSCFTFFLITFLICFQ